MEIPLYEVGGDILNSNSTEWLVDMFPTISKPSLETVQRKTREVMPFQFIPWLHRW